MEAVPALKAQILTVDPDADATPMRLDFGMLRASVLAAQAATPTARAIACADIPVHQVKALHGLLGDLISQDERQSWLHGRFSAFPPFSFDEPL